MIERGFVVDDVDAQIRAIRVRMAMETGWSFEQIDNLSLQDYTDILAVWEGIAKAQEVNNSNG
jgi:hypothetical protein